MGTAADRDRRFRPGTRLRAKEDGRPVAASRLALANEAWARRAAR